MGKFELMKHCPSSARSRGSFSDVKLGFLPRGQGYSENTHKILTQESLSEAGKGRKKPKTATYFMYSCLPSPKQQTDR